MERERRREELRRSLENPHPECAQVEELGIEAWFDGLPAEDAMGLLDDPVGVRVEWVAGAGWREKE